MILTQKFIHRSDLKKNHSCLYLFGDNTLRKGMGGQAGAMRGEPNAVGVATKRLPSQMDNSYFSDDDYESNVWIMWADLKPAFEHIMTNVTPLIIPEDGLGTGLSELPTRAPRTNRALEVMLDKLYLVDDDSRNKGYLYNTLYHQYVKRYDESVTER